MAIDRFQERIRKTKNPIVLDLTFSSELIPPNYASREQYCTELMESLKGQIPAVRFSFGAQILSEQGTQGLCHLLKLADKLGYYILLDIPDAHTASEANLYADLFLKNDCIFIFDGLITGAYIGSDGVRPFAEGLAASGKDLFVLLRSANRSAPELQDLMTGGRLVHTALADVLVRFGERMIGKNGYSAIAGVGPGSGADHLRNLRNKYKSLFILVDGADLSNASIKNCASAFDRLGHGAAICVGESVTGAWKEREDISPVQAALESIDRIKKNISRYVTIL